MLLKGFTKYFAPPDPGGINRDLDVIRNVLNRPFKKRTEDNINSLVPLIKEIQFFKEREIKDPDLADIASCLTYEYKNQGQMVFDYGSYGDKFYIILQGQVSVLIPNPSNQPTKIDKELIRKQTLIYRKQMDRAKKLSIEQYGDWTSQTYLSPDRSDQEDQTFQTQIIKNRTSEVEEYKDQPHQIKQMIDSDQSISLTQEDDDDEEIPFFVEILRLGMGKSFGELALILNKPRAASIQCLQECHFAVMSKGNYQRILSKIELKNQNKLIDFFHSLPVFKNWTRGALLKLNYQFERKNCIMNQAVVNEGDQSKKIILIRNGEFEVKKKVVKEITHNLNIPQILEVQHQNRNILQNPQNSSQQKSKPLVKLQKTHLSTTKKQLTNYNVSVLGPGQLFGEYEAINNQNYEYSLVCRSLKGEYFMIDTQEFIKRVSHHDDSWQMVKDKGLKKSVENKQHILKSEFVQNANLVAMDKLRKKMQITQNDNVNYKKQREENDREIRDKLQKLIKEKDEAERQRELIEVDDVDATSKLHQTSRFREVDKPLLLKSAYNPQKAINSSQIFRSFNQSQVSIDQQMIEVHNPAVDESQELNQIKFMRNLRTKSHQNERRFKYQSMTKLPTRSNGSLIQSPRTLQQQYEQSLVAQQQEQLISLSFQSQKKPFSRHVRINSIQQGALPSYESQNQLKQHDSRGQLLRKSNNNSIYQTYMQDQNLSSKQYIRVAHTLTKSKTLLRAQSNNSNSRQKTNSSSQFNGNMLSEYYDSFKIQSDIKPKYR